jgi:arsenate reductase
VSVTIYHNPRCSKSRAALELLRGRGADPEIIEYLEAPPTEQELRRILKLLGMNPRDLLRSREAKEAGRPPERVLEIL